MKALIIMALTALFAAEPQFNEPTPEDFTILSDKTEAGVRTIVATPSPLVCAKRIDIKVDVKTRKIQSVVFTRGCSGNGKAVGALLQGMTVDEAVAKLSGIPCGQRGTSCTDQLSRVLKKAFKM